MPEINEVRWLQLADRKNSPNRGIRRGRLLTSQTAFGGQLPYEGSLGRPAAGVKDLKKVLDNSFTQ